MSAPSACVSAWTVERKSEGVEASPMESTSAPWERKALSAQARSLGAEIRLSCPSVTRIRSLPVRALSHTQKPLTIRSTTGSVKSTGCPSTPSAAVPRISLPLKNFSQSGSNIRSSPFLRLFSRPFVPTQYSKFAAKRQVPACAERNFTLYDEKRAARIAPDGSFKALCFKTKTAAP